jgi:hypothetical protein
MLRPHAYLWPAPAGPLFLLGAIEPSGHDLALMVSSPAGVGVVYLSIVPPGVGRFYPLNLALPHRAFFLWGAPSWMVWPRLPRSGARL